MKIVNKDKFSRAVLIMALAITLIFTVKMYLERSEVNSQIKELKTINTVILEAYEETKYDLENYMGKEIYEIRESLEEQKKELEQQVEELKQKETELKEWETKLDARQTEKDQQIAKEKQEKEAAAKRNTVVAAANYPTRGEISRGEVREVYFEVTMYTNAEGAFAKDSPHYGTMANGEKTHAGAVAGPRSLPFGTKIVLDESRPGFEYLTNADLTVKDRGGAIKQKTVDGKEVYCIDIYQPDLQTALNWGRQTIPGKIIVP